MTNRKKTNWTPELPLFHKRKGSLKTDRSVKMPWLKCSYTSVPSVTTQ